MIVLTAATKREIASVSRCLEKTQEIARDGYVLWQSDYKNKRVLLVQTGVGRSCAERAISSVLETHPATALVSFGFAGALIPELAVGDLVLCTTVRCLDGGREEAEAGPYQTDADLRQRALESMKESGLKCLQGSGVTVPRLAWQANAKQALGEKLPAQVCEMEDYWIARVARTRRVPFLAVRVILDDVKCTLPDFEQIVDQQGKVRLGRTVTYLLTHPRHLWRAPQLQRDSSRAGDSLAAFTARFLERL